MSVRIHNVYHYKFSLLLFPTGNISNMRNDIKIKNLTCALFFQMAGQQTIWYFYGRKVILYRLLKIYICHVSHWKNIVLTIVTAKRTQVSRSNLHCYSWVRKKWQSFRYHGKGSTWKLVRYKIKVFSLVSSRDTIFEELKQTKSGIL